MRRLLLRRLSGSTLAAVSLGTAPALVRTVRRVAAFPSEIDPAAAFLAAVLSAAAFAAVAPRDLRAGALADMVPVAASVAAAAAAAGLAPVGDDAQAVVARATMLAAVLEAAERYAGAMVPGEPPFTAPASSAAASAGGGGNLALAVALADPAGGASITTAFTNLTLPDSDSAANANAAGGRRDAGAAGLLGMSVLVEPPAAAAWNGGNSLTYKTAAITVRVSDPSGPAANGWSCPAGGAGGCLALRVPVVLPPAVLAAAAAGDHGALVCLRHGGDATAGWAAGSCAVRAVEPDPAAGAGAAVAICDAAGDGVFRIVLLPQPPPAAAPPQPPVLAFATTRRSAGTASAAVVGGIAAGLAALALAALLPPALLLRARREAPDYGFGWDCEAAAADGDRCKSGGPGDLAAKAADPSVTSMAAAAAVSAAAKVGPAELAGRVWQAEVDAGIGDPCDADSGDWRESGLVENALKSPLSGLQASRRVPDKLSPAAANGPARIRWPPVSPVAGDRLPGIRSGTKGAGQEAAAAAAELVFAIAPSELIRLAVDRPLPSPSPETAAAGGGSGGNVIEVPGRASPWPVRLGSQSEPPAQFLFAPNTTPVQLFPQDPDAGPTPPASPIPVAASGSPGPVMVLSSVAKSQVSDAGQHWRGDGGRHWNRNLGQTVIAFSAANGPYDNFANREPHQHRAAIGGDSGAARWAD